MTVREDGNYQSYMDARVKDHELRPEDRGIPYPPS